MNEEKQRIAIAEECGWTVNVDGKTVISPSGAGDRTLFAEVSMILPDYPNDLNAMHEAEKVLTDDQLFVMSRWLQHSTRSTLVGVAVMTATASQRAEAFLKTINKWEDSELRPFK
tara:strand:- start:531 stop:875 length:345 start_codon:yes stop_codon:yes gene_type:complete